MVAVINDSPPITNDDPSTNDLVIYPEAALTNILTTTTTKIITGCEVIDDYIDVGDEVTL